MEELHESIVRFLSEDHRRLGDLLARAIRNPAGVDLAPYAAFRRGLLKHIGMEERILFPAAFRRSGGVRPPFADRLRLQHGAIAALLVPSPTPGLVSVLSRILEEQDAAEEGANGIYAICERLVAEDRDDVLSRLREAPEIPVSEHVDGPRIVAATCRALERAGYEAEAAEMGRKESPVP